MENFSKDVMCMRGDSAIFGQKHFFLKMEQFFRNTEIDNFFFVSRNADKKVAPFHFIFTPDPFFCEIVRKLSSHKQKSAQEVQ